jgi:HEAT repeat protein
MIRFVLFAFASLLAYPVAAAEPKPSVDDLVRKLESGSPVEKVIAAEELADLGPAAAGAIPALAKVVRNTRPPDDARLLYGFRPDDLDLEYGSRFNYLSRPVSLFRIKSWLRWPDPAPADVFLFHAALEALERIGPKAIPTLSELLTHRSPEARAEIAFTLKSFGAAAAPAVEALTRMLTDGARDTRLSAMQTLRAIGPEAEPAISALIDIYLESPPSGTQQVVRPYEPNFARAAALDTLIAIGPKAVPTIKKTVVPFLLVEIKVAKTETYQFTRDAIALKELAAPLIPEIVTHIKKQLLAKPWDRINLCLMHLGPEGIKAFAELLKDKDDAFRGKLLWVLAEDNTTPYELKTLVPTLLNTLEDQKLPLRLAAALVLTRLGEQASEDVVKNVFDLLEDPLLLKNERGEPQWFRLAVATARFGPSALPQLTSMLKSKRPFDRLIAMLILKEIGGAGAPTLPTLREATHDANIDVALEATIAAARVSLAPRDAAVLILFLRNEDPRSRLLVLQRLRDLGPLIGELEDELAYLMVNDRSAEVRKEARQLIINLPNPSPEVLSAAARSLAATRPFVVPYVRTPGPGYKPAVPALIKILEAKDDDIYARGSACRMLGGIGPEAKDAVPALIALLKHDSAGSGRSPELDVLVALIGIGAAAKDAAPAVEKLLKRSEGYLVRSALLCLGEIGAEKQLIPTIKKYLDEPDPQLRLAATYALLRIEGDSPAYRATLRRMIRNRQHADFALHLFGLLPPEYPELIPDAVKALSSRSAEGRGFGAIPLAKYGVGAKVAVPELVKWLNDPLSWSHAEICQALAAIGPDAKDALPKLKQLLNSRDVYTAAAARDAIARIESKK